MVEQLFESVSPNNGDIETDAKNATIAMHFYACNDFNGATLNLQQRKLNISLTLLSFMEKALALVTHENKTFLLLWIRFQLLNSKVTLSKIVLITAI